MRTREGMSANLSVEGYLIYQGSPSRRSRRGSWLSIRPFRIGGIQRCFNSDHISTASGLRYHLLLTVLPERYLHRRHQTRVGCELLRPGIVAPEQKIPIPRRTRWVYRPAPDSFQQRSRTIRPAAGWREWLWCSRKPSPKPSARNNLFDAPMGRKKAGWKHPAWLAVFPSLFGHRTALGLTISLAQRYPTFPFARVFAFAAVRIGCGITLRFAFACVHAAAFDLSFFGRVDVLRK